MKHPEKHLKRGTSCHIQLHGPDRLRRVAVCTGKFETGSDGSVLVGVRLHGTGAVRPQTMMIDARRLKLPQWG